MRPSAIPIAILILASCSSQQPSGEPDPSATPVASSPPATSAASTAPSSGPTSFEDIEAGSELAPGTYVLHYASIGGPAAFPTLAVEFTVPADWDRVRVDGLVWNDEGARLGFIVADNLYADPCNPAAGLMDPPVGASVDDLTTALLSVPGWDGATVEEGVFAGFSGQHVEVAIPDGALACDKEASRLFHTLGSPGYTLAAGSGEVQELWILNVEGTRLVIGATAMPDASADLRAELRAVLSSIAIEP